MTYFPRVNQCSAGAPRFAIFETCANSPGPSVPGVHSHNAERRDSYESIFALCARATSQLCITAPPSAARHSLAACGRPKYGYNTARNTY
jgi:hypothetical protein